MSNTVHRFPKSGLPVNLLHSYLNPRQDLRTGQDPAMSPLPGSLHHHHLLHHHHHLMNRANDSDVFSDPLPSCSSSSSSSPYTQYSSPSDYRPRVSSNASACSRLSPIPAHESEAEAQVGAREGFSNNNKISHLLLFFAFYNEQTKNYTNNDR